jgi:hypothetical protein
MHIHILRQKCEQYSNYYNNFISLSCLHSINNNKKMEPAQINKIRL